MLERIYPSDIIAQVERIETCPGKQPTHEFYTEKIYVPNVVAIVITQSSDGTFSGYNSMFGVTNNITGRVTGDAVSFQCTQIINAVANQTVTIIDNGSGTKSANAINGNLNGTYNENSTFSIGGCSRQYIHNASFNGTFRVDGIGGVAEVDTLILSGPQGATNQRNVTFTWMGVGGDGGIAGYYYKLDSQAQIYTTQTSTTFNNLSYGPHTFSVAAKDAQGNIDSTPAISNFTVQEAKPPDPANDSQFGNQSSDKITGDPINITTGNMHIISSDLVIPGRNLNFEFIRTYNSQENASGPLGFGWTHSYNLYLTEEIDELGDSLIKIKDEQAKGYLFAYDSDDGTYIAQRGEYSTLSKSTTGYVWTKKDGKKYFFNLTGKLTKISDRNNNTISLTYDSQNRLIQITDTVSRQINLTYNAQNHLTRISDAAGRNIDYAYDSAGNLIKVTNPENNSTLYQYDSNHNLTKKTNARGDSVYFTYDSSDRCSSSTGEANKGYTGLSFDPANKKTIVTDSKNKQSAYYYNDDYLITKMVNSLGGVILSSWDTNLNLISRNNELGRATSMEYDLKGNLTKLTDALGNISLFTYEPNFNLLKTSTDASGNVTTYNYDTKGNLLKVTDALANTTTSTYNSYGQVLTSTNALGKITYFTYDTQGNLASTKDALNNITTFSYDGVGNLIQSKDARGNITKYVYNELNQLIQVIYPDNSLVSYTYDAVGNRISVTDPNSNTTSYTYDQDQRVKSVTDALGHTITYDYDTEGNLVFVADQNHNRTTSAYDSLNRLISQTNDLNYQTTYQYDAVGNRISTTDAKTQTISYAYDNLNRLKKITYPDSTVNFAYDALGRRISMTDFQGTTNYAYDKLSRLTKVDGPGVNDTVEYSYDKVGSRLTMKDPDGKITKYSYDALNRLISVTDPQGKVTKYTYDTVNNLVAVSLPNTTSTSYTYDNLNRLLKLTNQKGTTKLSEFSYTYDRAGRRTSINLLDGRLDYSYDARGQLTQEVKTSSQNSYSISYAYDAAGNRLRMITNEAEHSYLYNELNQLAQEDIRNAGNLKKITVTGTVSDASGIKSVTVNGLDAVLQGNNFSCANVRLTIGQNTITVSAVDNLGNSASQSVYVVYQLATSGISEQIFYLYDENGNLVRKQKGSEVVSLSYDPENRLMKVSGSGVDVSYAYDGEGRRSWAKEGAVVTTNYLYDGLNVILERNSAGATNVSYIRNPNAPGGIGGIISSTAGTQQNYYHYDGLGSVVKTSNSTGTIVNSYTYDSFGNIIASQGLSPAFLTKELDKSGLIYFGARYYDPRIGRFITQDPSGMADGPNLYLYCLNNPVNYVDLWGLRKEKPWWQSDPGFGERFWEQFYKDRLPGADWLSPWPIPGQSWPKWTAAIGPAGTVATEVISRSTQKQLIIRATRDFTSFSVTRSFVYVSGLKPAYWAASKFVQGVLSVPTVFYGAADIGTAIESAIEAWRKQQFLFYLGIKES